MPVAIIDTDALAHNLDVVKNYAPRCRIMAVVKADGYGHGIQLVIDALKKADAFAVARISEALSIRQIDKEKPIIVLGGVFTFEEFERAIANRIQVVVHQKQQLEMLISQGSQNVPEFWLKFDTGMGRLGFHYETSEFVLNEISANNLDSSLVGIMSHLANADDQQDNFTLKQIERFSSIGFDGGVRSLSNSAAIMAWEGGHFDWVRPGIMLYGASPFPDRVGRDLGLKPVMEFSTKLISIKQCRKGEKIGYGGIWECPENMPVGVISAGYADGYPRETLQGTPVLINGVRVPLVGRVSMDMMAVDLRKLTSAAVGDKAILWGADLPVEEVASAANTISYTLLSGITQRVEVSPIG